MSVFVAVDGALGAVVVREGASGPNKRPAGGHEVDRRRVLQASQAMWLSQIAEDQAACHRLERASRAKGLEGLAQVLTVSPISAAKLAQLLGLWPQKAAHTCTFFFSKTRL